MTNQEAIERIERHRRIHFASEYPHAVYITEALNLAIEALKGQEPRVLTLEEVETAEFCMEPVFVEMLDENGKPQETPDLFSWRFVGHITPLTDGKIYVLNNIGFSSALYEETYSTTWRCWTSRPTDEQRKAVKWEPPKEENT